MVSDSGFKEMYENIPIEYQLLDINGNVIEVNKFWLKTFGYEYDEVIGKWFGDLLTPESVNSFKQCFDILKKEDNIHSEFEMVHKNGSKLVISFEGIIGKDAEGNFKCTHCVLTNITGQRKILQENIDQQKKLQVANKELTESLKRINVINKELLKIRRKAADSELLYKSLIESSNAVVAIIDENGKFLFINIFGALSINTIPENIVGRNMHDFFPPEIADKQLNAIKKVISTGEVYMDEDLTVVLGEMRWYSNYIYPLIDSEGKIKSAILNTTDITDRKLAVEALEKQIVALTQPLTDPTNIRFTDLFNIGDIQKIQDAFASATHVASVITTPEGIPITSPSNFCRLCSDIIRTTTKGLENCRYSDAIIGKESKNGPVIQHCLSGGLWDGGASIFVGGKHLGNWLIGQVKEDNSRDAEILKYADEIGADRNEFEKALKEVPVMSQAQFKKVTEVLFLLANELSVKAFQNMQQARFIAQRKRAESALLESEERNRALINANPDLMFLFSKDGIFLDYVSPNDDLLVMPPSQFLNRNIAEVLPKSLSNLTKKHIKKLFDSGKDQTYEYSIKTNKEIKYYESRLVFCGKDKALSLVRDITVNKRINEELVRAKEHAEESDRLKSAFLANMSHEIRTPMNAIFGFIELLSNPGLAENKRERYIDIIKNSGQQLISLINDIIDVSKIETNQISVSNTLVNVVEVVEGIVTFFSPVAQKKGIRLLSNGNLNKNKGIIETDEIKLNQILNNLISNAIKFTDKGTVKVGYEFQDDYVQFYIKDTGIGIRPENQDIIFDRFRQVEMGEIRNFGGAGLGLSITKAFVELLGGKIWVKSEFGQGTTFYFTLPVKKITKIGLEN